MPESTENCFKYDQQIMGGQQSLSHFLYRFQVSSTPESNYVS